MNNRATAFVTIAILVIAGFLLLCVRHHLPQLRYRGWTLFCRGHQAWDEALSVDADGCVYVIPQSQPLILVIGRSGSVVRSWPLRSPGQHLNTFDGGALAVDDSRHLLYASDSRGDCIRVYDTSGSCKAVWGPRLGGWLKNPDYMCVPRGLAVGPTGDVYVADNAHARILRLARNGQCAQVLTLSGNPDFNGVAVDGLQNVYVTDGDGKRVLKFDISGRLIWQQSTAKFIAGLSSKPTAVAIAPDGVIFVADRYAQQVLMFDSSSGQFLGAIDVPNGERYGVVGPSSPSAISLDKDGHLYVADAVYGNIFRK